MPTIDAIPIHSLAQTSNELIDHALINRFAAPYPSPRFIGSDCLLQMQDRIYVRVKLPIEPLGVMPSVRNGGWFTVLHPLFRRMRWS